MDDLTGFFYCYGRMSSALSTTEYPVEVKGVRCFIWLMTSNEATMLIIIRPLKFRGYRLAILSTRVHLHQP